MGSDEWATRAYNTRGKYNSKSPTGDDSDIPLPFTKEGSTVVWAACLRDRNKRLISQWSAKNRGSFLAIEQHMFRFGMACIGLENTLAGGGTYVNHQPQFMWSEEQETLYSVIKREASRSLSPAMIGRLDRRLTKYSTMQMFPNKLLGDSPPDPAEVHKFARIARKEYSAINSIKLDRPQRNLVLGFEKSYLIDYLGIRGADGSPDK